MKKKKESKTISNKTKQSDKPEKMPRKKIEYDRLMQDGRIIKDKGVYYKTADNVEVAISRDSNGKYYATELSTGKRATPISGHSSLAAAVKEVDHVSGTIRKMLDNNVHKPLAQVKTTAETKSTAKLAVEVKDKTAAKSTNKPIKVNIPTKVINLALSTQKMKELEKDHKKREVDKLVKQGIDRKTANVMYDAYKSCGVEHVLNQTSKSDVLKKVTQENQKTSKVATPAVSKKVEVAKQHSQGLEVTTYCINKGTKSQYFGLKTVEDGNSKVLNAPNNWKTENGALKWAEKNGFVTSTSKSVNPKQAVATAKPAAKQTEQSVIKRRVYKVLPQNYSVVQGTVAQSDGTILIHNGKPLLKQTKDGTMQQAKDRHGKPAHKVAALIVDPKAFNQAKNVQRNATPQKSGSIQKSATRKK